MCINHDMYHFPIELRDIVYRLTQEAAKRHGAAFAKRMSFLLLKNATCIGLLDLLEHGGTVEGEARERMRVKVLSIAAAYGVEAAALIAEMQTAAEDDNAEVPF